jgi:ABC-type Fe3+-hydroxamate transport system, periplasmic component
MLMRRLQLLGVGVASLLLFSCGNVTRQGGRQGDTLSLHHARLLTVVEQGHGLQAIVADPWQQGHVLQRYDTPGALRRVVVFTAAHCQLLVSLGLADRIVGVCDLRYMLVPEIRQRVKAGRIVDCGDAMSPDLEKIIDLHPDAIIVSPFEGSGGFGKLEQLGIPIIQAADYMEPSALGRAEWMRYYGRLFGEGARADSLFHVVDSTYRHLKAYAAKLPLGRSILTERKTGATWYTPGGRSTMATIISDAHGRYAFAGDTHSGSLALSVEQIIDKAGESDVWAFKYNGSAMMTRHDLLREYHGYKALKAFRTGTIYECNTSVVPYFDETPFRPDYLLREMIQLLHPKATLAPLRYYRHIDIEHANAMNRQNGQHRQ